MTTIDLIPPIKAPKDAFRLLYGVIFCNECSRQGVTWWTPKAETHKARLHYDTNHVCLN